MRPALLRACSLSFFTRAASRLAAFLAATRERYLEWRRPQTFTPHQPECSAPSILILFIAGLPRRRRGFADAFTSRQATRCARGQRVKGILREDSIIVVYLGTARSFGVSAPPLLIHRKKTDGERPLRIKS
jgi:hypothetical protein